MILRGIAHHRLKKVILKGRMKNNMHSLVVLLFIVFGCLLFIVCISNAVITHLF